MDSRHNLDAVPSGLDNVLDVLCEDGEEPRLAIQDLSV